MMTSPSESPPLSGLRVVFFESRMAGPTADLVAKHGDIPLPAPRCGRSPWAIIPK